jgi:hypothetical protein
MNQSSRFSSGGVSSSKMLSDDDERVFRRRWRHDAEYRRIWSLTGVGNSRNSPILLMATEAADRDRGGLTLGSV